MRVKELFAFIKERESIRIKKERGDAKPWTNDPILQSYKFCNIRREDDRVSRWIAEHWRNPWADSQYIWFPMVIARLVNWPDSLAMLGHTCLGDIWKPTQFLKVMKSRRALGEKMYTGSYMIHASAKYDATYEYQEAEIYTPMWKARKRFDTCFSSLSEIFELLKQFECMGDFMAAQVIADIKYTSRFGPNQVDDWDTFAAPGPGSKRGLNRVLDRDKDSKWTDAEWLSTLLELREKINPLIKKHNWEPLHTQDLQNCLCEWDKHQRVLLNEGRPRSLYPGK